MQPEGRKDAKLFLYTDYVNKNKILMKFNYKKFSGMNNFKWQGLGYHMCNQINHISIMFKKQNQTMNNIA